MLERRDFLKMLGLVGAGLVLPKAPVAPPQPRVFQLDKTMLGQPLAAVVANTQRVCGVLIVNGVEVGNVREWTVDQHMDYGFSGYNRLYSRRVLELEATLMGYRLNSVLFTAYTQGTPVEVRMWTSNDRHMILPEAYITEVVNRPGEWVVSGRAEHVS